MCFRDAHALPFRALESKRVHRFTYLLSMPSEVKSGSPYSLIVNYHSALIINYKTKLENPHISIILSP